MSVELTREGITELLLNNDRAVIRAIVLLNARQTADEQLEQATTRRNGVGVRPCHARMLTSMAEFYAARGFLSPKQIAYWRKPDANGTPRIALYWAQLVAEAKAKQAANEAMP